MRSALGRVWNFIWPPADPLEDRDRWFWMLRRGRFWPIVFCLISFVVAIGGGRWRVAIAIGIVGPVIVLMLLAQEWSLRLLDRRSNRKR